MSNPYFRFKQFSVHHDRCGHKVGVDGVSLGVWANIEGCERILDIGTGSGLIALMLAQRSQADVIAIDLDKSSIEQACENFQNSPFGDRLIGVHTTLQDFQSNCSQKFDLIVSNPPFFENSFKAKGEKRTKARHTDTLPFDELVKGVNRLLSVKGRFCLILPVVEAERFVVLAESENLYCSQKTILYPNEQKEPKRWLLEFLKRKVVCTVDNLVVEQERHTYTSEYTKLVKDFYLKL